MTYIMDYDVTGGYGRPFYGRMLVLDDRQTETWNYDRDNLHVMRRQPLTSEFRARLPRKLKKLSGLRPPAPDFMEWYGHPILSRRARDVFERIAGTDFDFIDLDDSAWPKRVQGAGYSLLYLSTVIECIDVEKSDLKLVVYPEGSILKIADANCIRIAVKSDQTKNLHLWCGKPYSTLGLLMISDGLHDAWVAAGLGPMGYIRCIDM